LTISISIDMPAGRLSVSPAPDRASIAAYALMLGVGGLVYNILPIFLGAAADSLALSHSQTGFLGSAHLLGFGGMPLTTPLWIHRLSRRRVACVASLFSVIAFLSCALCSTFGVLLVASVVSGMAGGVLFSLSVLGLGEAQNQNSERAFAVGQTVAILLAAICVWTMPTLVIPRWGFGGVALELAAVALAVTCFAPWFLLTRPKAAGLSGLPPQTRGSTQLIPVFIAMVGFGFYYLGLAGLWSFLERIGKDAGLSPLVVANAFSIEKIMVLLVCVLTFWQANHLGRRLPLIISCGGMILATLMLAAFRGPLLYVVAVSTFGVFWTYGFPFQASIITTADRHGRYASVAPAFMGGGSTIGPVVAGLAVSDGSYANVYILMSVFCVIGTAMLLMATQLTRAGVNESLDK
jgi:DHA1 family inner membrane transport protein